ncbi:Gfo/Idh/MocA family oxidoreductase [Herbiconiux sp. CPCC 205763]|uniref:Gfo/Idh/MocA family oxidoreductase n=1 Tax=Herbiconiux aconitum TaxID=2970913 RepID=A0ABT2GSG3_9MICO|nr:Gfo/Idh/MocA family oxidoreductase [Herbiconiux aconitum]MCS5719169.1 Gfo/Idh/MocA family oxidoreductase [Herbiconiux aconitum]
MGDDVPGVERVAPAPSPVRIGLVGAGQWARTMHAPLHSAGAETQLTGIWSPSGRGVAELAAEHGVTAFDSFDELLASNEAVDFAVPPQVQAGLAMQTARAGKALMLEKPLGASLDEARQLRDVVREANVPNIVVMTKRFHPRTRAFLRQAASLTAASPAIAVTARYVHGGFLGSGFLEAGAKAGWRDELGVLFDLGPHLLDLVDEAAGAVVAVRASGDPREAVLVVTEHADGGAGSALLSGRVETSQVLTDLEVYSNAGTATYSTAGMDHDEVWPILRAEFAAAVRTGAPVTVDVRRAFRVQELVDAAARSLAAGGERMSVPRSAESAE